MVSKEKECPSQRRNEAIALTYDMRNTSTRLIILNFHNKEDNRIRGYQQQKDMTQTPRDNRCCVCQSQMAPACACQHRDKNLSLYPKHHEECRCNETIVVRDTKLSKRQKTAKGDGVKLPELASSQKRTDVRQIKSSPPRRGLYSQELQLLKEIPALSHPDFTPAQRQSLLELAKIYTNVGYMNRCDSRWMNKEFSNICTTVLRESKSPRHNKKQRPATCAAKVSPKSKKPKSSNRKRSLTTAVTTYGEDKDEKTPDNKQGAMNYYSDTDIDKVSIRSRNVEEEFDHREQERIDITTLSNFNESSYSTMNELFPPLEGGKGDSKNDTNEKDNDKNETDLNMDYRNESVGFENEEEVENGEEWQGTSNVSNSETNLKNGSEHTTFSSFNNANRDPERTDNQSRSIPYGMLVDSQDDHVDSLGSLKDVKRNEHSSSAETDTNGSTKRPIYRDECLSTSSLQIEEFVEHYVSEILNGEVYNLMIEKQQNLKTMTLEESVSNALVESEGQLMKESQGEIVNASPRENDLTFGKSDNANCKNDGMETEERLDKSDGRTTDELFGERSSRNGEGYGMWPEDKPKNGTELKEGYEDNEMKDEKRQNKMTDEIMPRISDGGDQKDINRQGGCLEGEHNGKSQEDTTSGSALENDESKLYGNPDKIENEDLDKIEEKQVNVTPKDSLDKQDGEKNKEIPEGLNRDDEENYATPSKVENKESRQNAQIDRNKTVNRQNSDDDISGDVSAATECEHIDDIDSFNFHESDQFAFINPTKGNVNQSETIPKAQTSSDSKSFMPVEPEFRNNSLKLLSDHLKESILRSSQSNK